jgi:hypothetical protein
VQTERVVGKDNTVEIGDRLWQIDKTKFRNTLAGCTVTIHEHVNGEVSLRYGPHQIGHFNRQGESEKQSRPAGLGKSKLATSGSKRKKAA